MRVAWIGLGAMGAPMALAAVRAGHAVAGYARRPDEHKLIRAAGGTVTDRILDILPGAELVCIALFSEEQVREVAIEGGVVSALSPGSILAVHSTVGVPFMHELAGLRDDVTVLDAGFSGGPQEALAGVLTLMVGGDPEALARALPVFESYAGSIAHAGPIGSGMALKLLNNLMFAAHAAIARDALRLVAAGGLAVDVAVATLMRSSGGSNALKLLGDGVAPDASITAIRPYLEKDVPVARTGFGGLDLGALDIVTREFLDRGATASRTAEGTRKASMALPDVPTTRFDIAGDETTANPWPALAELRSLGAIVRHEAHDRWLVTTDREVRRVLVAFDRFTVEGTTVEDLFGAGAFIASDDRRRHDRLRNVWANAFRKQGLDTLRPTIAGIVETLLGPVVERLRDGEHVDLSAAVCRPLPTLVIAAMMGIADEALGDLVRWSDAMAAGGTTYLSDEQARIVRAAREEAKGALAGFLTCLLVERRRDPGDDLVSQLVASEPARELPDDQLVQNVRQLLFAGNETTAKWLAQIFVTYGERPDVRADLATDRTLVMAANDEVMRWQPPVGTLVRRVRGGPAEIGGVMLRDGDDVTCMIGAANRDPARYADPDRFDARRPNRPNLGFGVGFHNCLGLALAKLEADVVVNRLLDSVPDFAVAAPYRYSSLPLRGPLPVVVALDRG